MNFRLILLTTGFLTASALGAGCSRDELAPWGFPKQIGFNCTDYEPGVVGRPYTLDLNTLVTGGVAPFTFTATGLPPGLELDSDTGLITGTPTEAGSFDELVITVTDAAGESRTFQMCGSITINPPDEATCRDDTGTIPDGFVGIDYSWSVSFNAGPTPYVWTANGLPPGLTINVDPNDSTKATIEGVPSSTGTFNVELVVTDDSGAASTTQCGELVVTNPIQVDHGTLFADVDGCIPIGDGDYDSLADLFSQGILGGDQVVPITCELRAGRGNGSGDFDKDKATDDTMPPGITLNTDSCTTGGSVDTKLAYGIYGFITTFSQSTSASSVSAYVPYCAPQMVQAPNAYGITREDTGNPATFLPGVQQLDPGEGVLYGTDVPDPKVTVDYGMPCMGGSCYYAFVFSYNTLSGNASVSANPNAKFPADGFEGFTHGIRFTDADQGLIDRFAGRAWITNITYDYCIANNNMDCGNNETDSAKRAEKVRANGNGSTYYFSLVLLPVN